MVRPLKKHFSYVCLPLLPFLAYFSLYSIKDIKHSVYFVTQEKIINIELNDEEHLFCDLKFNSTRKGYFIVIFLYRMEDCNKENQKTTRKIIKRYKVDIKAILRYNLFYISLLFSRIHSYTGVMKRNGII